DSVARADTFIRERNAHPRSIRDRNGAREFSLSHLSIFTAAFATQSPDTPNGKFIYRRIQLSAPKSRPRTPLNAGTLMLFSDDALIPVSRINLRISRIGRKKVMFA